MGIYQVTMLALSLYFLSGVIFISGLQVFDPCDVTDRSDGCPDGSSCTYRGCDGSLCLCNDGLLPDTNRTGCVTGVGLGADCTGRSICRGQPFSNCINNVCQCIDGYKQTNSSSGLGTHCLPKPQGNDVTIEFVDYRDECNDLDRQCSFDLECKDRTCQCPSDFRLAKHEELAASPYSYFLCRPQGFQLGVQVDTSSEECQKQYISTASPTTVTTTLKPSISTTVTTTRRTTRQPITSTSSTRSSPTLSTTRTPSTISTTLPTTRSTTSTTPTSISTTSSAPTSRTTPVIPTESRTTPVIPMTSRMTSVKPETPKMSSSPSTTLQITSSTTTPSTISTTRTPTRVPRTASPTTKNTPTYTSSPTTLKTTVITTDSLTTTKSTTTEPSITQSTSTVKSSRSTTVSLTTEPLKTSSRSSTTLNPLTSRTSPSRSTVHFTTTRIGSTTAKKTSSPNMGNVTDHPFTNTVVSITVNTTDTVNTATTVNNTVNIGEYCSGRICPNNSICEADLCGERRCRCQLGYAISNDGNSCLKLVALGESCTGNRTCQGPFTECTESGICDCKNEYQRSDTGKWCRLKSRWLISFPLLGESCSGGFFSSCYMDFEQDCVDSRCKCKEGEREVGDVDRHAMYPDIRQCRNSSYPAGARDRDLCKNQSKQSFSTDIYNKAKAKIKKIQGAIIGGSVGFLVLIGILIGLIVLIRWKRRGKKQLIRDTSSMASSERYSFKLPRPFTHYVGVKEYDSQQIAYPNPTFQNESTSSDVRPDVINVTEEGSSARTSN